MGLTRVPKPEKDDNPNVNGEGEEEEEDSENEDSEDEISPPSSPGHIQRMQLLQEEQDRLERESRNQDAHLEQVKIWAAQMKYHTTMLTREVTRLNAKIAAEKQNGASATGNRSTTFNAGVSICATGTTNTGITGSIGGVANDIEQIANEIRRFSEVAAPPPPSNEDGEEDGHPREEGGDVIITNPKTEEEDQDDQPPTNKE